MRGTVSSGCVIYPLHPFICGCMRGRGGVGEKVPPSRHCELIKRSVYRAVYTVALVPGATAGSPFPPLLWCSCWIALSPSLSLSLYIFLFSPSYCWKALSLYLPPPLLSVLSLSYPQLMYTVQYLIIVISFSEMCCWIALSLYLSPPNSLILISHSLLLFYYDVTA